MYAYVVEYVVLSNFAVKRLHVENGELEYWGGVARVYVLVSTG